MGNWTHYMLSISSDNNSKGIQKGPIMSKDPILYSIDVRELQFFSQHLLTQFIHATTCGAASSNLAYTCLYYVLVVYCFDDEKRKDFFPLIEWKCYTWSLKKAFMVASLNSTIPFNLFCSAPCLVVNFPWIKQQIKCNQYDRLLYESW